MGHWVDFGVARGTAAKSWCQFVMGQPSMPLPVLPPLPLGPPHELQTHGRSSWCRPRARRAGVRPGTTLGEPHRSQPTWSNDLLAELSSYEEDALLRIANGDSGEHDVEEAAVSRLQLLALVEQRGVSLGLTLSGVRKVARLRRS
jgi:hypothetical protein